VVKRATRIIALATLILPSWAGCSSILGLEDAHVSTPPAEGGPPPTLCDEYCDLALANCPDLTDDDGPNFTLYFSRAECLATCAVFPEGNEGDDSGNSVHCRMRAARLAVELNEPEEYCPRAGPGGNGGCGENCEGFCTMARAMCLAEFDELQSELTDENCDAYCAELPDLGGFDIDQDTGNSVQCRLYHASAATLDFDTHCDHVADKIDPVTPGGPCHAVPDGGI
jgi:hypothetical protein